MEALPPFNEVIAVTSTGTGREADTAIVAKSHIFNIHV
jgi:hypothetical protein